MIIVSRSSVFFPNVARHIRQSAIRACAPRSPKFYLGEQFRSVSRFPERIGRLPGRRAIPRRLQEESGKSHPLEDHPTIEGSPLWASSSSVEIRADPTEGLKRLLSHDVLVITRQIEMMNLFIGFEQANRYAINTTEGEVLGYIAEEQRSFLSVMSRQVLRTHRPFRALILDAEGSPILWLRRPFSWINSRMYVQRMKEGSEFTTEGDPILETFAEVQQRWHLWRRRYDLFISDRPKPILSRMADRQPEPEPTDDLFSQFANIDSPFLAWTFLLRDAREEEIASIDRAFRGFGREIFTDTGQYTIRLKPVINEGDAAQRHRVVRELTLKEKAVTLATAVNIDYDYFSRHSEGGHIGFLPFFSGGSE